MDNFNIHGFLREQFLNENKGVQAAEKIIAQLREKVYRKLNDDELYEFRKIMADHISADLREEDEKPSKETIPAYKIIFTWADDVQFYSMDIYEKENSERRDHKLGYFEAQKFLDKFNIKPKLPRYNDAGTEKDIQAIYDQIRNRDVIVQESSIDVS